MHVELISTICVFVVIKRMEISELSMRRQTLNASYFWRYLSYRLWTLFWTCRWNLLGSVKPLTLYHNPD